MNIIERFLSTKLNILTQQSYRSALRQFAVFHWQLPPYTRRAKEPPYDPLDDVTDDQWLAIEAADIRAYLVYAESKGLSVATRSRHLTALKGFIDEVARLGLYDETGNNYIKNRIDPPTGKGEHHTLITPDDQNAILKAAADQPGLRGLRDYLIVRLLLETGIRRFELLNLLCRNVSIKAGQTNIYVEFAKADQTRDISIERETYDLILEWLSKSGQGVSIDNPLFCPLRERHRGGGDYIALNQSKPLSVRFLNYLMSDLVAAAGIDPETKITPHSFRVSLITDTIQGGATLRHAQKIAGHADPRMVADIYDRSQYTEPISGYRKHKLFRPDKGIE